MYYAPSRGCRASHWQSGRLAGLPCGGCHDKEHWPSKEWLLQKQKEKRVRSQARTVTGAENAEREEE